MRKKRVNHQNPCFSKSVLEYLPAQRGPFSELWYLIREEDIEKRVQSQLVPSSEDLYSVIDEIREFRCSVFEGSCIQEGIQYMHMHLGGVKAEYRQTTTPREVAEEILNRIRHHWHSTRGVDCAPYISVLTESDLVIGFPISIYGLRTLAQLQQNYHALMIQKLDKECKQEKRVSQALTAFKQQRK